MLQLGLQIFTNSGFCRCTLLAAWIKETWSSRELCKTLTLQICPSIKKDCSSSSAFKTHLGFFVRPTSKDLRRSTIEEKFDLRGRAFACLFLLLLINRIPLSRIPLILGQTKLVKQNYSEENFRDENALTNIWGWSRIHEQHPSSVLVWRLWRTLRKSLALGSIFSVEFCPEHKQCELSGILPFAKSSFPEPGDKWLL